MFNFSYPFVAQPNREDYRGEPAGRPFIFGDYSRFSITPMHSRFGSHAWALKDAENPSTPWDGNNAPTVGVFETFAEAMSLAAKLAEQEHA